MTAIGATIGASPEGKRKARWRARLELARVADLPAVGAQALACVALAGDGATAADYSIVSGALLTAHVGSSALPRARRLGISLLATAFAAFAVLGALHGHALVGLASGAAIASSIVLRARASGALAPVVSGLARALPYACVAVAMSGQLSTDAGTAAAAMLAYAMGVSEVERAPSFSLFAMAMLLVAPFLLATLAGASHDVSSLAFVVTLGVVTAVALLRATRGESLRAAKLLVVSASLVDAVVLARFGFLGLALAVAVAPMAAAFALRQAAEPTRAA